VLDGSGTGEALEPGASTAVPDASPMFGSLVCRRDGEGGANGQSAAAAYSNPDVSRALRAAARAARPKPHRGPSDRGSDRACSRRCARSDPFSPADLVNPCASCKSPSAAPVCVGDKPEGRWRNQTCGLLATSKRPERPRRGERVNVESRQLMATCEQNARKSHAYRGSATTQWRQAPVETETYDAGLEARG
jgi:hypothetical protein